MIPVASCLLWSLTINVSDPEGLDKILQARSDIGELDISYRALLLRFLPVAPCRAGRAVRSLFKLTNIVDENIWMNLCYITLSLVLNEVYYFYHTTSKFIYERERRAIQQLVT